jgi:predicted transposase YbfD/YdcC
VSACSSSPIDAITDRVAPVRATTGSDQDAIGEVCESLLSVGVAQDLLVVLAAVADPRARRGRRHRLVSVLAVAVCAVLAGARSYVAMAEWAADLPISVRVRLGLGRAGRGRGCPSESTIRRILQAVDPDALDRALCDWLACHPAASPPVMTPTSPGRTATSPGRTMWRAVAVDGKTARGSRVRGEGADGSDTPAVGLFAAFDHQSGIVLGQTPIADNDRIGKGSEIAVFAPLLDRVDLTEVVVTADALHTQDAHARYLHERGGHYVFIVKGNRPRLRQQLAGLPWREISIGHRSDECGHGRREQRTLQMTAVINRVTGGILFPHAQLAVRVLRRRRRRATAAERRWQTEIVYAVTDLRWDQIRADDLAEIIRRHWAIENRLHWIRDVVFAEDHSQVRTGNGPAVMASLRNFAVSRHRLAGATNIAAACRDTGRHPWRAANLLT